MPFKDTITADEFNAIPENDRVLYIHTKGENGAADSYNLHPSFVAERTAQTNANKTILDEKKRTAAELQVYKELGLSAEQIADLKKKADDAETAKLSDEDKRKKADDALKQAHSTELERVKTAGKQREDFLMKELRRSAIETAAKIAIKNAGPIDGADLALLPHIMGAMELVEEGDGDSRRFVTRIMADGAPRYVGSEHMSVDQLVEEFKLKTGFGGLFKAEGVGGGGAGQQRKSATAATGVTMKRSAFDALDSVAQRQHITSGGKVID